jgi:hypothetical protein
VGVGALCCEAAVEGVWPWPVQHLEGRRSAQSWRLMIAERTSPSHHIASSVKRRCGSAPHRPPSMAQMLASSTARRSVGGRWITCTRHSPSLSQRGHSLAVSTRGHLAEDISSRRALLKPVSSACQ